MPDWVCRSLSEWNMEKLDAKMANKINMIESTMFNPTGVQKNEETGNRERQIIFWHKAECKALQAKDDLEKKKVYREGWKWKNMSI